MRLRLRNYKMQFAAALRSVRAWPYISSFCHCYCVSCRWPLKHVFALPLFETFWFHRFGSGQRDPNQLGYVVGFFVGRVLQCLLPLRFDVGTVSVWRCCVMWLYVQPLVNAPMPHVHTSPSHPLHPFTGCKNDYVLSCVSGTVRFFLRHVSIFHVKLQVLNHRPHVYQAQYFFV